MKTIGKPEFINHSYEDGEGNIFIDCVNQIKVKYQNKISFECFKEGVDVPEEWKPMSEEDMEGMIDRYGEGFSHINRNTSADGKKVTVDYSESKTEVLSRQKTSNLNFDS